MRCGGRRENMQRRFNSLRIAFASLCVSAVSSLLIIALSSTSAARRETTVELVAVGDILLDRGVARSVEREGTRTVFARVKPLISNAGLAFGNLESPVTIRCERVAQRISFRAEPSYLAALTGAGFDVVSLANNHSMDCGRAGLIETMRNLNGSGLRWCGAGLTQAEAEAPVILNAKGIRIAFVGFTAIKPPALLKDEGATVATADRASLQRAVAAARGEADVVVVSLHWGIEYASRPGAEQRELAHAAAEAGADLILGHHTHTLEGLELIETRNGEGVRRTLVIYSLGNFVFDSPRAFGKRVRESVILRCKVDGEGLVSAGLVPVVLENNLPRPASGEEAQSILARMASLSSELKTRITGGRVRLKE